jgi:hypothetical protein
VHVLKNPFPLFLSEEIQKEILSTSGFFRIVVINEYARATLSAESVKALFPPLRRTVGSEWPRNPLRSRYPFRNPVQPSAIFKAQSPPHTQTGEEGKGLQEP